MTFSQRAALHFVPLLARLVLGAAFITAGMAKLFHTATFEGENAQKLKELGVVATAYDGNPLIFAASFEQQAPPPGTGSLRERNANQDNGAQDAGAGNESGAAGGDEAGTGQDQGGAGDEQEPTIINVPTMSVDARELHRTTLLVANTSPGLAPYATYLGWGAALTEFVGGILILIGLFSRLWGFALAVVMGTAFYYTSLSIVGETMIYDLMPSHANEFHQVFAQLALFVLAFGVFLTGPGKLSVDGFIFGKGDNEHTFTDEDEI